MSKVGIALGTVVGAVGGFVTGILIAPKSGKETRAEIKGDVVKAKDVTVEKAEEIKDKASQVATDVAEKAKDVVGDVTGKAKHAAQDVTSKAEELKNRVEQAVEGAQKGYSKKPAAKKTAATKKK